jgi:hypothetical protein
MNMKCRLNCSALRDDFRTSEDYVDAGFATIVTVIHKRLPRTRVSVAAFIWNRSQPPAETFALIASPSAVIDGSYPASPAARRI